MTATCRALPGRRAACSIHSAGIGPRTNLFFPPGSFSLTGQGGKGVRYVWFALWFFNRQSGYTASFDIVADGCTTNTTEKSLFLVVVVVVVMYLLGA
jgi:hypothetical protein